MSDNDVQHCLMGQLLAGATLQATAWKSARRDVAVPVLSQGVTCKAWMSKMTTDVGPPRERGMLDKMRAIVKAVATSPSDSTRSRVPVGKKGNT